MSKSEYRIAITLTADSEQGEEVEQLVDHFCEDVLLESLGGATLSTANIEELDVPKKPRGKNSR